MTRYWIIWSIVMVATFAVPEFWAILTGHPQNTFSETLWRGEHLGSANPLKWTFVHLMVTTATLTTLGWLVGHFGWGLWR